MSQSGENIKSDHTYYSDVGSMFELVIYTE